ncbi:unnamed protein product [Vitrella brassicaformis CCMP3155]|uniref:Uncharacterized protein n=1 Tax=Vitrella brassicaformis (strain CCMP3155) TaxID=1169540 RepID=A0A0G4GWD3_VITBC|nr:unnamed protein product [Vitrella brassicaformis CCMP3155]|eukprot:CEM35318.1 unnamed protein product [Vitrella brassicaformis CCMP3155]
MGSVCPQCLRHVEPSPSPPDSEASPTVDRLISKGIAYAQRASVAKRQAQRLFYLHCAREMLMKALKRCVFEEDCQRAFDQGKTRIHGGERESGRGEIGVDGDGERCRFADPGTIRIHLSAVLLKLGEPSSAIQGVVAELRSRGHVTHQLPPVDDRPPAPALQEPPLRLSHPSNPSAPPALDDPDAWPDDHSDHALEHQPRHRINGGRDTSFDAVLSDDGLPLPHPRKRSGGGWTSESTSRTSSKAAKRQRHYYGGGASRAQPRTDLPPLKLYLPPRSPSPPPQGRQSSSSPSHTPPQRRAREEGRRGADMPPPRPPPPPRVHHHDSRPHRRISRSLSPERTTRRSRSTDERPGGAHQSPPTPSALGRPPKGPSAARLKTDYRGPLSPGSASGFSSRSSPHSSPHAVYHTQSASLPNNHPADGIVTGGGGGAGAACRSSPASSVPPSPHDARAAAGVRAGFVSGRFSPASSVWSLGCSPSQSASRGGGERGTATGTVRPDQVLVEVRHGVSSELFGALWVGFDDYPTPAHMVDAIDEYCRRLIGQPLGSLLTHEVSSNRKAPIVRDDFEKWIAGVAVSGERGQERRAVLFTKPIRPPGELTPITKLVIKSVLPCKIPCGVTFPVRLEIRTSVLQEGHDYSVALTNQWDSGCVFTTEAVLLPDRKGVECLMPSALTSNDECHAGLYDVHLLVDQAFRSANRRAISILSATEGSPSSIASSFGPGEMHPPAAAAAAATHTSTPSNRQATARERVADGGELTLDALHLEETV